MKITRTYLKAKNGLLLNVGIILLLIVGTAVWYLGVSSHVKTEIYDLRDLTQTTDNVYNQGLVSLSHADIDELGSSKLRAKKIQFLQKLFPEARAYVFSEDPTESLDLQNVTLSLLEKPKGEKGAYTDWLESSFTQQMEQELVDSQQDLGEVVPVFVSVSPDQEDTQNIYGKVDLQNIVLLVQDAFFAAHGIPHVEGALGIRNVVFDDAIPDLGYYEIVARVENVPSKNILSILEFSDELGAIRLDGKVDEGVPRIVHLASIPERLSEKRTYVQSGRSALSNPLVTIPSLIIEPGGDRLSDVTNSDIDPYITLSPRSRFRNWNMIITFRFYVRGAAPEHIDAVDSQIRNVLVGSTVRPTASLASHETDDADWSLLDRIENALLIDCSGCEELHMLRQLRSDVETIMAVYEGFGLLEPGDEVPTSTEDIQRHMQILTVVSSIEEKFEKILNSLE